MITPGARLTGAIILALGLTALAASAAPPSWIEEATRRAIPAGFATADAVILERDVTFDYRSRGRITETVRHAVKVIKPDGRSHASFALHYNRESDRIKGLEIWIVPADGKPVRLRQRDCIDLELAQGSLYSESRLLTHAGQSEARPGAIYAFEYTVERRSIFAENAVVLNDTIPALRSHLQVVLPGGWAARSHTNNTRVSVRENATSNTWTWTATDIPAVREEQWRSNLSNLHTIVFVTVEPASEDARAYPLLSWSDWSGVAAYVMEITGDAAQPDADVRAKALELTDGLNTELERIRAIAEFVQRINYVSLALDLGQGGGYRPYPAGTTLRSRYGDCKDKANLMRSMLSVLGIEAYPIIALLSDDMSVDPDWPSPSQFNHCIIGVSLDEAAAPKNAPVVAHPQAGALLLFDPTDETTRFGNINFTLQGSRALLGAAVDDPLIEVPFAAPERNRTDRQVDARLTASGDIDGRLQTRYHGLAADRWRQLHVRQSPSDFERAVTAQLRNALRDAAVTDLSFAELKGEDAVELALDVASRGYARSMRGRLLIFQPAMLSRNEWVPPAEEKRETSLRFTPSQLTETVAVELPEGFVIDEMPAPVELEYPFASYRCSTEVEDRTLTHRREIEWRPVLVPATEYETVRAFFRAMLEADASSVVLVRE